MTRAVKKNIDGNLYINILDFKDEIEQDVIFRKVQEAIRDVKGRVKVF